MCSHQIITSLDAWIIGSVSLAVESEPWSRARAVCTPRTQSGKGEERSVPCWRVRGGYTKAVKWPGGEPFERNSFEAPGWSLGVKGELREAKVDE